jgi:hypothetical protein
MKENAEFQHFILRFNKNFLTLQNTTEKRGYRMEAGPKTRCEDRVTLWITLSDREFEDINKNHKKSFTSYILGAKFCNLFLEFILS